MPVSPILALARTRRWLIAAGETRKAACFGSNVQALSLYGDDSSLYAMLLIGSEAVAVGIYMGWWFPDMPVWMWALGSAATVVWVNTRAVHNFGSVEYWLTVIKVSAIVAFIIVGLSRIAGIVGDPIGLPGSRCLFVHEGDQLNRAGHAPQPVGDQKCGTSSALPVLEVGDGVAITFG